MRRAFLRQPNFMALITMSFIVLSALITPHVAETGTQKAAASSSLRVSVCTNQKTYLLRQKVKINGTAYMDGSPATDFLLLIEVINPIGQPIVFRTIKHGTAQQTLPIEITNIYLTDFEGNQLNTVKVGSSAKVCISVYNPYLNSREIYVTVTVFDANMIPLQVGYLTTVIAPGQTITPKFTIFIPEWATSGRALVCGNVYSSEPEEGGIAYSLEKTIYFCISRLQSGFFSYPELTFSEPQLSPGKFETQFTLPPDPKEGKYEIYVTAQADPLTVYKTSTTFQVQQSSEYPPQASFIYWPSTPYENQTILFDASSSTAEGFNDTIIRYEWDFGDGTPRVIKEGNYTNPPDPTVEHRYLNAGQYMVTLNVTDNEGLWSVTIKPVAVYPEFGPVANFTYTPTTPLVNQTITFNASSCQLGWSKTLGDYSPIINYHWNFSDGTVIDTAQPSITHNYTCPGNYTVTLTITDSVGRTDKTSILIQVYNVTEKPWDINNDGIVDIEDLYMVALHYGLTSTDPDWDPRCDINNDGIIDIEDLYTVALHYGEDP